jgi:hypothetical protein
MTDPDNHTPRATGMKKIELKRGETEVGPKNYGANGNAEPDLPEPLSNNHRGPQPAVRNQVHRGRPGGDRAA